MGEGGTHLHRLTAPAFVWALHPHRGQDGVHRLVLHVEATTALALLALPLVPGVLDEAVHAGQVPSLPLRKSIDWHINQETCTLLDQANGRGVCDFPKRQRAQRSPDAHVAVSCVE